MSEPLPVSRTRRCHCFVLLLIEQAVKVQKVKIEQGVLGDQQAVKIEQGVEKAANVMADFASKMADAPSKGTLVYKNNSRTNSLSLI